MRRFFLFCLLVAVFTPACCKKIDNGPSRPVPTAARNERLNTPAFSKTNEDNTFGGHIERIRNAATPDARAIQIKRAKNVKEADRLHMIAFLIDILENAPGVYDRIAAGICLIDINIPASLLPVKKVILFCKDYRLKAGLIAKLHTSFGEEEYKTEISKWCVELLNDATALTEYKGKDLYCALDLYACMRTTKSPIPDPLIFLKNPDESVRLKMYDIMMRYFKKEDLHLDFLNERITTQFNNIFQTFDADKTIPEDTVSPKELEAIVCLLAYQKIPMEELRLKVGFRAIELQLSNKDYKVCLCVMEFLPVVWQGLNAGEQIELLNLLKGMAFTDETVIENAYPIRTKAEQMISKLNG